jgi:hypothetical protein
VRLAADANVLLAAIAGGRTQLVLEHPSAQEVLTAAPVLDDSDFKGTGVKWYTTARLMKTLGIKKNPQPP